MKLNVVGNANVVVTTKVFGPVPGGVIVSGPLNGILKYCFPAPNSLKSIMPLALFPVAEVSFSWPTKSSSSVLTPLQTKAKFPAKVAGVTGPAVWARRVPSLVILRVGLLENGIGGRDQIEDEGEGPDIRIRPSCRAASESVGIHGISSADRAALRGEERDVSTVVLIEENRRQVAAAIRGEAAGRGDRPDRTGASNKKRKSAVQ